MLSGAEPTSLRDAAGYRADIDGLRAIAIVPVVFYHAGIGGFTGGYVGVDVFFVISGYLITRIILGDVAAGRFSFARFYERRARRILPALLVVVTASLVAGWFLLLPSDFAGLAQSAAATLVFVSNFYFADSFDYFAPVAEYQPLLHTWSLAVEEQFYLLFPILLLWLIRWRVRVARWAVMVLTLLSLGYSVHATGEQTGVAFFSSATRAWELGLGCLLALGAIPTPGTRGVREVLALVGIGFIAFSVTVYDAATPFPGVAALLPALGAALVIHASSAGGRTTVSAALSVRPLVWVGLISYSLYLWHWPLLAFLRHRLAVVDLPPAYTVGALAAAFALAFVSWRFVERPFRGGAGILTRRQVFASASLCSLAVLGISTTIWVGGGIPMRLSTEQLALIEERDVTLRCRGIVPGDQLCLLGETEAEPSFILWGDSHAKSMSWAISALAKERGVSGVLVFKAGCPPLLGEDYPVRVCRDFNRGVLGFIAQQDGIKSVIIHARWPLHQTGEIDTSDKPGRLIGGKAEGHAAFFSQGIRDTVEALSALGRDTIMLGAMPEIGWRVSDHFRRAQWSGAEMPEPASYADHLHRNSGVTGVVSSLQEERLRYVPIGDLICKGPCQVLYDGRPIYIDGHHLTRFGAEAFLAPRLRQRLWRALDHAAQKRSVVPSEQPSPPSHYSRQEMSKS
ncbi:acyltransferase family protein [Bauldia sp.]|uniref:acyltransferase family protein n=1 Tax=Bauldia sp. TaxID=2575872 RepID=UPI003BACB647